MGETFTKLSSSITESSVWTTLDSDTRIVWVTMMAMADADGIVRASIPGLAQRAVVSVEKAEVALGVFLAPDPYSRTEAHEGRRIERVPGGWRLLNHALYRGSRDIEERRRADRLRKQRQRERGGPPCHVTSRDVTESPPPSAQAEAEAEAEADHEHHRQCAASFALSIPPALSPSPATRRRDALDRLWAWFECELVRRGRRRQPEGLSDKRRRECESLIRHISQTLSCDFGEALESQRRHLEYRLATAETDGETRKRIRQTSPWGLGWWSWWHKNQVNARIDTRTASKSIDELYDAMVARGEITT